MLYDASVGGRGYCGPTVLAAITGLTVPFIEARIKQDRGSDRPVVGTYASELERVLWKLGYRMVKDRQLVDREAPARKVGWRCTRLPTLAQWLKRERDMGAAYILALDRHWVVVKGRWFVDTHTKGLPVRATKAPGRRRLVRTAWKVVRG